MTYCNWYLSHTHAQISRLPCALPFSKASFRLGVKFFTAMVVLTSVCVFKDNSRHFLARYVPHPLPLYPSLILRAFNTNRFPSQLTWFSWNPICLKHSYSWYVSKWTINTDKFWCQRYKRKGTHHIIKLMIIVSEFKCLCWIMSTIFWTVSTVSTNVNWVPFY